MTRPEPGVGRRDGGAGRGPRVLALLCLALALGAPGAHAQLGAGCAVGAGTDLPLLRPAARAGLEPQLGVRALDELPCYEIDQAVDDVRGTLSARLVLSWTNRTPAPITMLPLLLHPNAPGELGATTEGRVTVDEVATQTGPVSTWAPARPTLVLVRFADPVLVGQRIQLAVRYSARLRLLGPQANDALAQAFQPVGVGSLVGGSDYGLLATGDGIFTVASAYPMVAPFRDGEFDTSPPGRVGDLAYNDVAHYRVRTVVPAGVSVVTNLVDRPPERAPDGNTLVVSEGALVRDFVLVGGRDLQRQSTRVGETTVTSIFRARDARAGRAVLEVTAAALASLERRFGPYPYTELDVVEASLVGGAGGAEFPGLVLVAGMLYRSPDESLSPLAGLLRVWGRISSVIGGAAGTPGTGATSAPPSATPAPGPLPPLAQGLGSALDRIREFTVAHEVAHQYFAGLVGNDSLRFPILDEPLAQYAAGLVVEDKDGPAAAQVAMDANVKLNYAVYRLLGGPDRPAARDITSFRSRVEYAGLVYGKAPYLYVALRQTLGEDRLHTAIRNAVERYRFRLVTPDEWFAALETAAGGPASGVQAARTRWLEDTHGDADLGVDDSGDFVFAALFPPELAASLRTALPTLGWKPRDLFRLLLGGALGDDAPVGPGLDPAAALRALERLRR